MGLCCALEFYVRRYQMSARHKVKCREFVSLRPPESLRSEGTKKAELDRLGYRLLNIGDLYTQIVGV